MGPGNCRSPARGCCWWAWLIAANSYIVKAALEWSSTASVVLVILQWLVEAALLLALFAPGHT